MGKKNVETEIEKAVKEKTKGHDTWVTMCEGHEIKVINKLKARMYIDGAEVAKEKGLSTSTVLVADIPDTEKTVIAMVYMEGDDVSVMPKCRFIIGEQAEAAYGFTKKDGTFSALTAEEEEVYRKMCHETDEAALTASIISIM